MIGPTLDVLADYRPTGTGSPRPPTAKEPAPTRVDRAVLGAGRRPRLELRRSSFVVVVGAMPGLEPVGDGVRRTAPKGTTTKVSAIVRKRRFIGACDAMESIGECSTPGQGRPVRRLRLAR